MDLHVPDKPIKSLKEFLVHIGIVTIGILIALGLEQIVEAHHRANRAAEALDGFAKEITDNQEQVSEALKAIPGIRADIAAEVARLQTELPADASADEKQIHYPGVAVDLVSNASWDAAIATQAISDLPYDVVHRYSEAFNAYRLFEQAEQAELEIWQELRAFGDDRSKLSPEDRTKLIGELRRYDARLSAVEKIGKSVGEAGARALHPPQK